jgi:hypothetical protein
MADNVGITPGSGATAAADDIGGVLHQRVKLTLGADGVSDGDVSSSNPMPVAAYGELIEAIEALRLTLQSLMRTGIGQIMPDIAGTANALQRLPVLAQNPTAANLNATITLAASQTLATLTNQTQIGGFAAVDQIPALMHLQADNLRRNITVT